MVDSEHPRLILQDFLTVGECKELEFVHKSCCTIGYRPGVLSTTLSHLIATNCSHLIVLFVRIRERLKDKVEEFFGCEFELFVEFTGLISWCRGASIGWHSDDNRAYLKQRDFAVVCYLNDYGKDFQGGLFHFQSGEPKTVVPTTGEVVMYTADCRNIHSVDEVISGERLTLTLWFTRDHDHDEDAKLIALLSQSMLNHAVKEPDLHLPLPAPSNMYWFPSDQVTDSQGGFNICWARIHAFGLDLYSSWDGCLSELPMKPLQLAREMELCELVFNNIMHVLQVLQFYSWKAFGFQHSKVESDKVKGLNTCSEMQQGKIFKLKSLYLADRQMAETVLDNGIGEGKYQFPFDWGAFYDAFEAWQQYTNNLQNDLRMSLPLWSNEQSLFFVPVDES